MLIFLEKFGTILWTPIMLVLLGGSSVFFTAKFKFLQFSKISTIFKSSIGSLFAKKTGKDKISPFAAMSAALAGTMGVGNIAGVATAITAGGAGAVFWMWISALFCMILKYMEVTLSQLYKVKGADGNYTGGPMYYIKRGAKSPFLAGMFAVFCIFSSFGMGNMTQANTLSQSVSDTFGLSKLVIGLITAFVAALIILGGIKRIVSFTSFFVPLVSFFYLIFAFIVLFAFRANILPSLKLIFSSAFSFEKAGWGIIGYTISRAVRFGISRGIFSNEAGLGSAPIAHAAADNEYPAAQGMWGIFEVFFDTIISCTLTALVILSTGALNVLGTDGNPLDGVELTSEAFRRVLGYNSDIFLSVSIAFFAISTIICWSYYGESCVRFLVQSNAAVKVYKIVFIACIVLGSIAELKVVWLFSDIFNALMAIPNLLAITVLYKQVEKSTREYLRK